jgi:uncharacterized membrane protein (UPF0182 family)
MPLEVGQTINYFADSILKAPLVHTIVKNPIYTALLITFIVVLLIMFIFRDADTDDSLLVMCLRSGFWIFFMMLGVLFLHNKVLGIENFDEIKNGAYDSVFSGGYSGVSMPGNNIPSGLEDSIVPVHINTDFTSF